MPIQESAPRLVGMNTRTDPRQLALAARLTSLKQAVLVGSAGLAMTFWWLVAPAATATNAVTASTSGDRSSATTTDDGASTFFGDDDAGSASTFFGSTSAQTPVLRSHGS
jgi:hypothetical protein